jgi:hypothetical protein
MTLAALLGPQAVSATVESGQGQGALAEVVEQLVGTVVSGGTVLVQFPAFGEVAFGQALDPLTSGLSQTSDASGTTAAGVTADAESAQGGQTSVAAALLQFVASGQSTGAQGSTGAGALAFAGDGTAAQAQSSTAVAALALAGVIDSAQAQTTSGAVTAQFSANAESAQGSETSDAAAALSFVSSISSSQAQGTDGATALAFAGSSETSQAQTSDASRGVVSGEAESGQVAQSAVVDGIQLFAGTSESEQSSQTTLASESQLVLGVGESTQAQGSNATGDAEQLRVIGLVDTASRRPRQKPAAIVAVVRQGQGGQTTDAVGAVNVIQLRNRRKQLMAALFAVDEALAA